MMLSVVPREPVRRARGAADVVGVVGEADGVAQIGTHGGDEGEPGLGSPRESFLLFTDARISFNAPQKNSTGGGSCGMAARLRGLSASPHSATTTARIAS